MMKNHNKHLPRKPHAPPALRFLAADLETVQRELAEKGAELAGVRAELEAASAMLAEATAAMQDAHDQLAEMQVEHMGPGVLLHVALPALHISPCRGRTHSA
mgnify:CR=1 FL=1